MKPKPATAATDTALDFESAYCQSVRESYVA